LVTASNSPHSAWDAKRTETDELQKSENRIIGRLEQTAFLEELKEKLHNKQDFIVRKELKDEQTQSPLNIASRSGTYCTFCK
jgi:hypothetical protein